MINRPLKLALGAACCLAAVSACSSSNPPAGLTDRGKPTTELTASINRFQTALKTRDTAALRGMATSDHTTDRLTDLVRAYGGHTLRATTFEGETPDDIMVAFSEVCADSGKLIETFGNEFFYRDNGWRPSFGDPKKADPPSSTNTATPTAQFSVPTDTDTAGC